MKHLFNFVYRSAFGIAPISVLNSYYRFRALDQPGRWVDFPFFFIHIPKAAGSSFCAALNMPDSGHFLFDEMPSEVVSKLARKPCVMIVRDPVERLLSTYYYIRRRRNAGQRNTMEFVANFQSPERFLDEVAANPRVRSHYFIRPAHEFYASAVSHGAKVDVLDFDSVNQHAPNYLKAFGIDLSALPKKNVSNSDKYDVHSLSPEVIGAVKEIYGADYSLLECSWKS